MTTDPQKENNPQGNQESFHTDNVPPEAATNNVLQVALYCWRLGFTPLPIRQNKTPLLSSWKQLQKGDLTEQQVVNNFRPHPQAGLALLTGLKDFAVVDIDDPDLAVILTQYLWDKTVLIGSQNAGLHIYVFEDRPSQSGPLLPSIADIKGTGGYVATTPTPGYHKVNDTKTIMRVSNAREWAAQLLEQFGYRATSVKQKPKADPTINKVKKGERNEYLISVAGFLRNKGLSEQQILRHLKLSRDHELADIETHPVDDDELQGVARSSTRYPAGNLTSHHKSNTLEVKSVPIINAGELQQKVKDEGLTEFPFLPFLGQKGFIPRGWVTIIAGYPKVGKTALIVSLIREWLKIDSLDILYISEEAQQIWERRLGELPVAGWKNVRLAFGIGSNLVTVLKLIETAEENVIIVDTIRNILGFEDENNNSEVARTINPVIELVRKLGKTLILAHHIRKGGGQRGEGISGAHALFGAVDVGLEITPDGTTKNRREVKGLARIVDVPGLLYEMDEEKQLIAIGDPKAVEFEEVQQRVFEVVNDSEEWLKTASVREELDEPQPSKTQTESALKSLAKEKKILRDPDISVEDVRGKRVKWAPSDISEPDENGGDKND